MGGEPSQKGLPRRWNERVSTRSNHFAQIDGWKTFRGMKALFFHEKSVEVLLTEPKRAKPKGFVRNRQSDRNVRRWLDELDEAKAFVAEISVLGRKNMPNEHRIGSRKRISCRETRNASDERGKPRPVR